MLSGYWLACVCIFLSMQVLQAVSLACLLSENACTRAGTELRFFDAEKQPDGAEVLRAKPSSWFGDEKVWFQRRLKSWWIVLEHEPWHSFVPTSARACFVCAHKACGSTHPSMLIMMVFRTLIFNARLRRHAGGDKTNVRAFLVVAK